MAVNPLKALIFLAGGLVAALAVAWFAGALDPLFRETPPVAASGPGKGVAQKGDRPVAAPSSETPNAEAPANANVVPPSFDILRVEPDGSIVIAGRAAPGAKIEILSGSQLIGKADVGGEGDFVAVLDEPLKPGDYQIVLRSTAPDNVVAASRETAIVSIPDQKNGQVLALVEQPGEPSRLITVPEPESAAPQAEAPQAPEAGQPGSQAAAGQTPPATEPEQAPDSSQEQTAADEGAPSAEEQAATAEAPPAPAPEKEPAAEDEIAGAGEAETQSREPASGKAEAPEAPAAQQPAESQPAAQPTIVVEAVEIEGRSVFVAGVADAGSLVRVYANEILLGETQASEAGRFLIETERDLPVGDYIIRADLLTADGTVAARAAVPFEREEGESIAAVAPPAASSEAPAPDEAKPGGEGTAASPRKEPTPGQQAEGGEQPPAEGNVATAPAEPSAPASPAGSGTSGPVAPAKDSVSAEPAPRTEAADGEAVLPELGTDIAAGPPVVTAPKLQAVDSAVIIRRGDNLWRISRRVYGRGVRYTTIYLANQDQISDPNRIWPGQVFAVPDKTPEGEPADMKAIGDRATTVPPKEQ